MAHYSDRYTPKSRHQVVEWQGHSSRVAGRQKLPPQADSRNNYFSQVKRTRPGYDRYVPPPNSSRSTPTRAASRQPSDDSNGAPKSAITAASAPPPASSAFLSRGNEVKLISPALGTSIGKWIYVGGSYDSSWVDQKHFLKGNWKYNLEGVTSRLHSPARTLISSDSSKPMYETHMNGIPKTDVDPRANGSWKKPAPKGEPCKRVPYKHLKIPKYPYDCNSTGPRPTTEIVISGLPDSWRDLLLKDKISSFGKIAEYEQVLDPRTQASLGIVRARFEDDGNLEAAQQCAMKAVKTLHQSRFDSHLLKVVLNRGRMTLDKIVSYASRERQPKPSVRPVVPPSANVDQSMPLRGPNPTFDQYRSDTYSIEPPKTVTQEMNPSRGPISRSSTAAPRSVPTASSYKNHTTSRVNYEHLESEAHRHPHVFLSQSQLKQQQFDVAILKKDFALYKWKDFISCPSGVYITFDSVADAESCFRDKHTKKVRGRRIVLRKFIPEGFEEREPVKRDIFENVSAVLLRDLRNTLQMDISDKLVTKVVRKFMAEKFDDLKAKVQPTFASSTMVPTPIAYGTHLPIPISPVKKMSDIPLHNLHFKKKRAADASVNTHGDQKRAKKETHKLRYGLTFPSYGDDDRENSQPPSSDHQSVTVAKKMKEKKTAPATIKDDEEENVSSEEDEDPHVDGRSRTINVDLYSSSSSDDDDDEEDKVKESIPTTPEVADDTSKVVAHRKYSDTDGLDDDAETEDNDGDKVMADVDDSGFDKVHAPTATELPVPVYEDNPDHVFNLSGLVDFVKDEEDFALLKEVLMSESNDEPILYDIDYWAWKQRNIAALNSQRTTEEVLPSNLNCSTGSHRSQGYVKIADELKVEYLPHRRRVHDPLKTISDHEEVASSKVLSSRVNRANNRRLANEMSGFISETNEIMSLNQLSSRRKPVSFARSAIHNWGLYALEPIAAKEMIIDYVGERIRQQVSELREKAYLKSGIGSSYLFRVDEHTVIDATKKGGIARFINHCCVPSCTAKIIKVEGRKHIAIYALRDIGVNEELTYDYKFERESNDSERVRCLCGVPGCKGYLN